MLAELKTPLFVKIVVPQYTDFTGTVHYIDSMCTFHRILSAVTRVSRNPMISLIEQRSKLDSFLIC